MSKSLGNLVFVSELAKEWDPRADPPGVRVAPLPRQLGVERVADARGHRAAGALDRGRVRLGRGARRGPSARSTTTSTPPAPSPPSTPPPSRGVGVSEAAALLGVTLDRPIELTCPDQRRVTSTAIRSEPARGPVVSRRYQRSTTPSQKRSRWSTRRRGGDVPRDAGQLQTLARAVLTPPFRFLWSLTTEGLEHLPAAGGAIIAPNHVSVLDSFFVPLALPRRITYVGKSEYMDSWKTKYALPRHGHDPDRPLRRRRLEAPLSTPPPGFSSPASCSASTPRAPVRATVGSTRATPASPGWRCGPARRSSRSASSGPTGPAARCPVARSRSAASTSASAGRSTSSRYADRADDRMVLRQITDEVVYEIRNLTGQAYVDQYAIRRQPPRPRQTPRCRRGDASDRARHPVPGAHHGLRDRTHGPQAAVASARLRRGGPAAGRDLVRRTNRKDGETVSGRRSSAAVLKARPLDFDLDLSSA